MIIRKAEIIDNRVTNVALFDTASLPDWAAAWVDCPDTVSSGDHYADGVFTRQTTTTTKTG